MVIYDHDVSRVYSITIYGSEKLMNKHILNKKILKFYSVGLGSHMCVTESSSHFPSEAYVYWESLYCLYNTTGRLEEQSKAK